MAYDFESPMATAVIGGLITPTLLTLVVVPVMYALLEDGVDAPLPVQPAAVYKFQPKDRTDVA